MSQRQILKRSILSIGVGSLLLIYQNCSKGFESFTSKTELSSNSTSNSNNQLNPFEAQAKTILKNNCAGCHGVDVALGNVSRITDAQHLIASAQIIPGQPEASNVYKSVSENKMPPTGPLSEADKNVLRNWILALGGANTDPKAPIDLSFAFKINTDPIQYRARLAKLSYLLGSSDSPALATVKANRYLLGDHNFASGSVPRYVWEATTIKLWMESILPVCAESTVKSKYPWPNGTNEFLQTALGRTASEIDAMAISEINGLNVSASEKFEVFCVMTLSSLEFVAK